MICEECHKESNPTKEFNMVVAVDTITQAPILSSTIDLCYPCFKLAVLTYKKETARLYEETF
jgi:hypothetical protein